MSTHTWGHVASQSRKDKDRNPPIPRAISSTLHMGAENRGTLTPRANYVHTTQVEGRIPPPLGGGMQLEPCYSHIVLLPKQVFPNNPKPAIRWPLPQTP